MILSRQRLLSLAGIATGAFLVYAMLTAAWIRHAHAAAEGAAALPSAAVAGLDIATAIALIVAVLVGVGVLLGGLSLVIRALQPLARLTATTVDDNALASVLSGVDSLHSKIDRAVEALGGGRVPVPLPPRDGQAGFVRVSTLIAMLAAAALGMAGVTIAACAGAREKGSAGAEAFIDCMAPDVAEALPDLIPLAKSAVLAMISGGGHVDLASLEADARAIKGNLGKCALATAIAILSTPAPVASGAPAAAGLEVHGAELRAAFAGTRAKLGWAPVHTSLGSL